MFYHIFFIQSPIDGPLGCFHVLAIVNNTATNVASIEDTDFVSFHYIPKSGTAGSYDNSIFHFLRMREVNDVLRHTFSGNKRQFSFWKIWGFSYALGTELPKTDFLASQLILQRWAYFPQF